METTKANLPTAQEIMDQIKSGAITLTGTKPGENTPPPAGESTAPAAPKEPHVDTTKKIQDMSLEEQVDYWKTFSRQNERAYRSHKEQFDAQAKELAELREKSMSDNEKALAAAKEEGATQARQKALEESATLALQLLLKGRGLEDEKVESVMRFTNPSQFISGGIVDAGSLDQFVGMLAGANHESTDMGQGRRGIPPKISAVDEARAEAKRRGERTSLLNPAQLPA